jgi:hypothetical protein
VDENSISVPCRVEGCNARVHGDVKCKEHGGDPVYQWRESEWGERSYYTKEGHNATR